MNTIIDLVAPKTRKCYRRGLLYRVGILPILLFLLIYYQDGGYGFLLVMFFAECMVYLFYHRSAQRNDIQIQNNQVCLRKGFDRNRFHIHELKSILLCDASRLALQSEVTFPAAVWLCFLLKSGRKKWIYAESLSYAQYTNIRTCMVPPSLPERRSSP